MSALSTDKLRTLHTAEVALRLLKYMAGSSKGMSLEEITGYVGKSKHTAYYLMNTLCQEGFAVQTLDKRYRLTALAHNLAPLQHPTLSLSDLKQAGQELHSRTLERVYLAVYGDDGLNVIDTWGKQGQPGLEGLKSTIKEELHALAVGKAVFASLPKDVFDAYSHDVGLKRFTPNTKCDPNELWDEVIRSQSEGIAIDQEEFSEGFCCLAIPVRQDDGVVATLGVAIPARRFPTTKNNVITALKHIHATLLNGNGGGR